jgi:hypothetical protein
VNLFVQTRSFGVRGLVFRGNSSISHVRTSVRSVPDTHDGLRTDVRNTDRLSEPFDNAFVPGDDEKSSMTRQLPSASRLLAGAMALALAVVSSATCFAATLQMPDTQQHMCCAAMADCGSSAKTSMQDCCVAQSPAFTGLVPIVASNLGTPSAIVVSMIEADVQAARSHVVAVDPDTSRPTKTPTYLLDSVFRL